MDQAALYDHFMPPRIRQFLDGVNVNVMAYGQTGSGKTHTMFGPPGIMARAASGQLGDGVCAEYGLFPRGVLEIFDAVEAMKAKHDVKAPCDGTVRSVDAALGNEVAKGIPILTLEA